MIMKELDKTKSSNNEISLSSSIDSSNMNPKSKLPTYECKICGAPAIHSNYGVITCYPCKMFFKRHVTIAQKQSICDFNDQCEININTRQTCSACRLVKCFENGMQTDLIRCPLSKQKKITKRKSNLKDESITAISNILTTTNQHNHLQELTTTNLLQSNNSILTVNQWTLLSNLIYNYDEQKLLSIAKQFINECNDLQTLEINNLIIANEYFMKIYETSRTYICLNSDFCTLSSDDRSAFLRNIVEHITCFGTVLSWNQSQIYNCKPFMKIYIDFYGQNLMNKIQRILKFIDSDIITAKLALSLFAFSNHTSIFSSNMIIQSLNTHAIFHIQNIYIETTWKYFLYKYGYFESIRRFNKLIQCFLVATTTVSDAQNNEKHINEITLLVEETELALFLDDIQRIDENKN